MTVVHPNHIVGINSITVQTGDSLSVHKADGSLIRTIVSNTGVSTFHAIEVSKGGGDLSVGISTLFADNSTGKIGIGTDIPGEKLSIVADAPCGISLLDTGHGEAATTIKIGNTGKDLNITVPEDVLYTLTSGNYKINIGGDERLRLDSSGRLMLGTTTEGQVSADDLTVAGSGNRGITIRSGTTSNGNIYFSDGTSGDAEYVGYIEYNHNVNQFAFGTNASAKLKIDSSGNTTVGYGNVGILTSDVNTEHIAGAASSFVGLYMNDGFIGFPTHLNRNGGYFIATHVNALNAGPVSLGSSMTLHGTWTIV